MAEETNAPAVADAPKLVEETIPATDAVAEPAVTEAKPAEEGIVATEGVAEGMRLTAVHHVYEANATMNQFSRLTTHKKMPPRKRRALPARNQRLRRLVMTQVSQSQTPSLMSSSC